MRKSIEVGPSSMSQGRPRRQGRQAVEAQIRSIARSWFLKTSDAPSKICLSFCTKYGLVISKFPISLTPGLYFLKIFSIHDTNHLV